MKKKVIIVLSIILACVTTFSACDLWSYRTITHTSGDFVYSEKRGPVFWDFEIVGLSPQGKQKDTIIIPTEIDGYKDGGEKDGETNRYMGVDYDNPYGNFESENMKNLYYVAGAFGGIDFGTVPNIEKIVRIDAEHTLKNVGRLNLNKTNARVYFSVGRGDDHSHILIDECGRITVEEEYVNGYGEYADYMTDGKYFWLANINYYYNYEHAPNSGYYWSDNFDYGTKIGFVPPVPTRPGYMFGGWYKEPECINAWNFDLDVLPQAKLNADGEQLYQETKLYAQWFWMRDGMGVVE